MLLEFFEIDEFSFKANFTYYLLHLNSSTLDSVQPIDNFNKIYSVSSSYNIVNYNIEFGELVESLNVKVYKSTSLSLE